MRRKLLLGGGLSLAAGGLSAQSLFLDHALDFLLPEAQAADFTYDLKPQRIAENTYALIGKREHFTTENGGDIVNVAFISTSDGVVLIDTGPSRRYGEALLKLIRDTTGKEVVRVYNTHFHPDHVLGNQLFDKKLIAALPNTISGLEASGEAFSDNLYRLLGDWMRGTELTIPEVPVTFSSEKFGDHRFEMVPLKGHTDADLAILDHKTGILFAGDLCFLDRAATTPHADIAAWQDALKELKAIPHKMIFPGHGPVDTTDRSIEQTSAYISWLEEELISAVKSGKDMLDAANMEIPEKFQTIDVIKEEIERSIAHLYPTLEETYLPFVGQGDQSSGD